MDFLANAVLILFALTPLLPYFQKLGFEEIKVLFFLFGMTIFLAISFLISFKNKTNLSLDLEKKDLLQALFISWLFLTSISSSDLFGSFFGKSPYYQGFIFYLFLFVFYLFISKLPIKLEKLYLLITLDALLVSVIAIKEWGTLNILHQETLNYAGRIISTFGQPNLFSGFLVMSIPFVYQIVKHKNQNYKFLAILTIVISILAIFLSQSRSSIITLAFLIIAFSLSKINSPQKLKKITLFSLLPIILLILWLNSLINSEFIKPISQNYVENGAPEKRVYIWKELGLLILEKPLTGYGLENIDIAFRSYFKSLNFNTLNNASLISLKDLSINRAHSYPLDILLYSGIPGLLLFLILIVNFFKNTKSKFLKLCMLTFLIWSSAQIPSAVHLIYFWLLLGLSKTQKSIA